MASQEPTLITDPWFYAVAVPAVLLYGISKGGFGGGLGVIAVPLMALVISPVQAAAILLPVLCAMDIVALWKFRGKWIWSELRILLPASLLGILIGTLLFGYMSASVVRLIVGVVAVSFTMHFWISKRRSGNKKLADFHRTDFAATTVLFFAVANYVKLVPYAWLGQLDTDNLATSAALVFLAPIGVLIAAWMHARVSDLVFFAFVYLLLFIVGLKLVYDGLVGLF